MNTDFFSVPVLANYFISFYTWFRLEKSKRMDTFLYPLLNLYNVYGKLAFSKNTAIKFFYRRS